MRLVIDTNILVSSFIFAKKVKSNLENISNNTFLYSNETYQETQRVFHYEKFSKFVDNRVLNAVEDFFNSCEKVTITKSFDVSEDKDDNHFINVAVNGNADYILSGDNHLLVIKEFKGIKIVTIKEFINKLTAKYTPFFYSEGASGTPHSKWNHIANPTSLITHCYIGYLLLNVQDRTDGLQTLLRRYLREQAITSSYIQLFPIFDYLLAGFHRCVQDWNFPLVYRH